MTLRRVVLAALCAGALLTGCTGDGDGGGVPPQDVATTGGKPHPLGFKWDLPRIDTYAPYLKAVGGGATFTEIVWCDVEPEPGALDWSVPDRIVKRAAALDQRVYLKLRVGSCWINGDRGGSERGVNRRRTASAMPDDIDAYRAFVRATVERYPEVQEFAVENEVNSPNFWSSTPEEYRRIVEAAASEVKAARASALVFDSGTSSVAYGVGIAGALLSSGDESGAVDAYRRYYARRVDSRSEFPEVRDADGLRAVLAGEQVVRHRTYLDLAIDLVGTHVTDALQIHYYEPANAVPDLTQFLTRVLSPGAPIEAWEFGLFWTDAPEGRPAADEALRSVASALAGGIRQIIWLPMAHNPDGRRADEVRLGTANSDGSLRPLGQALAATAAALAAAGVAPGADAGRPGLAGLDGAVFEGSDGGVVGVVWAATGQARLAGAAPARTTVLDALGAPVRWPAEGLVVESSPVIIRGGSELAQLFGS